MAFEEKRAWIMVVVSAAAYATYAAIIVGRVDSTRVANVPYVATMLWSIGLAIAVSIVANIAVGIASGKGAERKDPRDREIGRFGEYIGQSFLVIGGVVALGMAMAELDYFWIANVIYLGFVLSSILGSTAKIVGYRRGFQTW